MALENQVTFAEVGNPKRVTQLTENTDAAGAYFLTEKVGETAAKKTSYATVESAVKSKIQGEYLQALSATPASDKTMSEKLMVGELKRRDDAIKLKADQTAMDSANQKIVQLEQDNGFFPSENLMLHKKITTGKGLDNLGNYVNIETWEMATIPVQAQKTYMYRNLEKQYNPNKIGAILFLDSSNNKIGFTTTDTSQVFLEGRLITTPANCAYIQLNTIVKTQVDNLVMTKGLEFIEQSKALPYFQAPNRLEEAVILHEKYEILRHDTDSLKTDNTTNISDISNLKRGVEKGDNVYDQTLVTFNKMIDNTGAIVNATNWGLCFMPIPDNVLKLAFRNPGRKYSLSSYGAFGFFLDTSTKVSSVDLSKLEQVYEAVIVDKPANAKYIAFNVKGGTSWDYTLTTEVYYDISLVRDYYKGTLNGYGVSSLRMDTDEKNMQLEREIIEITEKTSSEKVASIDGYLQATGSISPGYYCISKQPFEYNGKITTIELGNFQPTDCTLVICEPISATSNHKVIFKKTYNIGVNPYVLPEPIAIKSGDIIGYMCSVESVAKYSSDKGEYTAYLAPTINIGQILSTEFNESQKVRFNLKTTYTHAVALKETVVDIDTRLKAVEAGIVSKHHIPLNIVLMGDSITWMKAPRSWVAHMLDRITFNSVTNLALSGAKWAHTPDTQFDLGDTEGNSAPNNVIWNQINRLKAGVDAETIPIPDVIYILCGTNDFSSTAGDASTVFSTSTFDLTPQQCTDVAKAFRFDIQLIQSYWTTVQILIATPLQRGSTADLTNNKHNIVRECAGKASLRVIDQYKDSGVFGLREIESDIYQYDNLHLNEVGALKVGKFQARELIYKIEI